MADNVVVKRLTIRATTEGLEKAQRDLDALKKAYEGVGGAAGGAEGATERLSKSGLSAAEAYRKQTLRLDEAARAQHKIAQETKISQQNLDQGSISAQQHAERVALITQHYTKAGAAAGEMAKGTGLARHEMVNLSRQAQDIGVSLASGQSPFTVLIQQGTQVADIFASSGGTIKGFFGQIGSGVSAFASVITPMRAFITGATTMATTAVAAGLSWQEAQADIQRSLIGIGRQSGANLGDINRIALEASKTSKIAASDARDMATALAATGKIGVREIDEITKRGSDFAKLLGVSMPEANKILAESFAEPATKGLQLFDKLGGGTAKLREQVRDLAAQFRFPEAQRAIQDALIPTLNRASEATGKLGKAWEEVKSTGKNWLDDMGRGFDALTGNNSAFVNLAKATNELNKLQSAQVDRANQNSRRTFFDSRLEADIDKAKAKVIEFQTEVDKLNAVARGQHFTDLGNRAVELAEKLAPGIRMTQDLTNALIALKTSAATPEIRTGMSPDQLATLQQAIQATTLQIQLTKEQTDVEARRNAQMLQYGANAGVVYDTLAGKQAEVVRMGGGISITNEKILAGLRDQLAVAQAYTAEERIAAQEVATRNRLIDEGVSGPYADMIAAQQAANALAAEYVNQYRQAQAEQERLAQQQAQLEQQVHQRSMQMRENEVQAMNAFYDAEQQRILALQALREAPGGNLRFGASYETAKGTVYYSQFKEGGYESTMTNARLLAEYQKSMYGPGGFASNSGPVATETKLLSQADRLTYMTNNILQSNGSIVDAINRVVNIGPINDTSSQFISTLTNLLPDAEKQSAIERQLENLRRQPITLARETLIKSLNDSLEQLKGSVDGLTASIDPLFTGGHEALRIGYYNEGGSAGSKYYNDTSGLPTATYDPGQGATMPGTPPPSLPIGPNPNWGMSLAGTTDTSEPVATRGTVVNNYVNQTFAFPPTALGERRRSTRQFAEGFGRSTPVMN